MRDGEGGGGGGGHLPQMPYPGSAIVLSNRASVINKVVVNLLNRKFFFFSRLVVSPTIRLQGTRLVVSPSIRL